MRLSQEGYMRQFSLRVKLSILFMLIPLMMGLVTMYQIRSINEFNGRFNNLVTNDFGRVNELQQLRFNALKLGQLAVTDIRDIADGKPVNAAAEQAKVRESAYKIQRGTENLRNYMKTDGTADFSKLDAALQETNVITETTLSVFKSGSRTPGQLAVAEAAINSSRDRLSDILTEAIAGQSTVVHNESQATDTSTMQAVNTNIILAAATAVAALALGLLTASILGRSIGRVREGAERVASGDFSGSIDITSHDELGQLARSFNSMAERLRESYSRLARERQRDETLLESMSDGLIAIDSQGNIALINSKAAEMFDINVRSTLMGRPLDEELVVYAKDDKPLADDYHPARAALDTGKHVSDTFTFHKGDGQKIIISITMSPVLFEGKADGVIMVIRDVTREVQVDRMKTEFISLASHQLRTPLSAIKWFSEMLLNGDAGELNPEQKDFAKNVSDSTDRMIQLVNSLLNISRIESGRIIIDPKPTDLHELVSGIVSDLQAKTKERQQNLAVSVHAELPKVNLDARLIGQVYMNLLTNAIKYTPKGGDISVFVSRKGDQLVSQVTDNGYGIPKAEQPKMFQKFFRAENVAKVETDGTGLGLYLIKAIVESSGGKIWFKSDEGKGTTFWFSLPMSGMKPKEGEVTLDG